MARPRKNPLTIDKTCPTCKNIFTISSRKYRQIYCSRSCKNHDPISFKKNEIESKKNIQ